MKERLDVLLVKQGLAESREKAKAVIMAGCVYVNDQKEDKAGAMFDEAKARLEVRGNTLRYVSRGGLKLEKAVTGFGWSFRIKYAWISGHPQAVLQTACCKTGRQRFILLM